MSMLYGRWIWMYVPLCVARVSMWMLYGRWIWIESASAFLLFLNFFFATYFCIEQKYFSLTFFSVYSFTALIVACTNTHHSMHAFTALIVSCTSTHHSMHACTTLIIAYIHSLHSQQHAPALLIIVCIHAPALIITSIALIIT